jgi:hypothetical protein
MLSTLGSDIKTREKIVTEPRKIGLIFRYIFYGIFIYFLPCTAKIKSLEDQENYTRKEMFTSFLLW